MSREHPDLPRQREPADLPSEQSSKSFWHSEPSPLLLAHRSTRNLPQTADVVVIGSGMTGASVAHHLLTADGASSPQGAQQKHGLDVVMLEAREACWGATGRNGGHCQPLLFESPHDPSIGHFELANFHTLQNMIREKEIDCEFNVQPGARAIYSQHHLEEAKAALNVMDSTAPELRKMMKLVTSNDELAQYRIPTAVGAVVTEIAARMWPYKFVSRILEDLITSTNLNGKFNLQTLTPVTALAPYYGDRWTVKTVRGCIVARKVILATNAYTSHLLPDFKDLIVPCRGQMSALRPLRSVQGEGRLKTSFGFLGDGLDDYLIQRPNERGGHLMFGGGRQHGPSIGVTDDTVVDPKTAKYLRTRLVEALGLPEAQIEGDACEYCRRRKIRCSPQPSPDQQPCTNCLRFTPEEPCSPHPTSRPKSPKEFTAANEWSGIMGFSRDERPFVGPVPNHPNLYMSAGYTGHGMPNTWLCGKTAALIVKSSLACDDEFGSRGEISAKFPNENDGIANSRYGAKERMRVDIYQGGIERACRETGLPDAYRLTEARVKKALEAEDVETKDNADMERGSAGQRPGMEPPHSDYA